MQFLVEDYRNNAKPISDVITDNRGLMFGDGFFTTGLIKNDHIVNYGDHIERLKSSADKLKFTSINFSLLSAQVLKAIQGITKAAFRITLCRKQTQRGYAINQQHSCLLLLQILNCPKPPAQNCQLIFAKTPISLNQQLAGIKHLNRLDNVLAASEVTQDNQEALMCHENKVICGSRSNLFALIDNVWITPSLDLAGINGITRKKVLDFFQQKQINYQIEPISQQQLKSVSAAFVTNSLIGIWPVERIDNVAINIERSSQLKSQISLG